MGILQDAPRNAYFEAWGRFVLRNRVWLAPLTLVATLGFGHQILTRLTVDTTTEGLLHKGAPAKKALDRLHATFGEDKLLIVQVGGEVFTLPFLKKLRALHQGLGALHVELAPFEGQPGLAAVRPLSRPGDDSVLADDSALVGELAGFGEDDGWGDEQEGSVFEEITSLVNVRRTEGSAAGLSVHGLLDDWPTAAELPALRDKVLASPTLVGQVVDAAGRHAAITLRTGLIGEQNQATVVDAVREVLERHDAEGFRIRAVGAPILETYLGRMVAEEAVFVFSLCMLVMTLALGLLFRHPLGVVGPLCAVVQAVIWTLGCMAIGGAAVTPVTNVLNSFVLCVGIGDTVHIQSVYRDLRRDGVPNEEAIVGALATTGMPVLFTTLTTMLGLLSFGAAKLGSIQDMGTFGALGVAFALLQALVFLPMVLTLNKRSLLGARTKVENPTRDWLDRFLRVASRLSQSRRALPVAVLVTLVAVWGVSRLRYFHDPMEWFPPELGFRDDVQHVDRHLGGSATLSLLVTAPEGGTLKDRTTWQSLEALGEHVMGYPEGEAGERLVTHGISALDVLKESWRAVNGGEQDAYRLPPSERGVVDMFTLFESAGPEHLKRLVTLDAQHAHMIFRVRWRDAGAYGPLNEHVRAGVDKLVPDGVAVEPTGAVFTAFSVVDTLMDDLIRSFGTALAVITLMMVLLFRDLKLGLIAMLPNLLPILMTLAFMGFCDMPVDVGNIMVASIAIGIAVDDTIHFLHQFQTHYRAHGKVEAALAHSFRHTGRAIVITSLLLAFGFVMFRMASLSNVQRFGSLVAISVVFALAADLLLAPALLRRAYRDRVEPPAEATDSPDPVRQGEKPGESPTAPPNQATV